MKTLGQRLRELRKEKDLSLRELGRKVDVSAAFLSDVELDRRNPSEKLLPKIAKALGTTAKELRSYDTRPPVEDLRRLAAAKPQYGLAFRQVIDSHVSAKDLMELAEKKAQKKKGKK